MRIVHLDTGTTWRGGQAQVLHLVRGLVARGHPCAVLARSQKLLEDSAQWGAQSFGWRAAADWDLAAALIAARAVRRFEPDIVHAHTARAHVAAVLAARGFGARTVVSRRVERPVGQNWFSRIKYRLPVERYLCVSRAVHESMRNSGVPSKKLDVVRSGIGLGVGAIPKAADRLREAIRVEHDQELVGTVASMTAEKGPETWFHAAVRVIRSRPKTHWVWIGEGPWRAWLARACNAVSISNRVHLLGFREDASTLLAGLTLFVMPSRSEGLGTTILEAQAYGVPVVATAVGGIGEAIEHDVNGWLVPPDDACALATGVGLALADPHRRLRWCQAAAQSVREFDIERTIDRTLEAYRAVLTE